MKVAIACQVGSVSGMTLKSTIIGYLWWNDLFTKFHGNKLQPW